jgi:fatty acid-binding protein DegV
VNAGWAKQRILELIERIGRAAGSLYTLRELKYLIHGGRISHMKGLEASVLNIKPLIGVETEGGPTCSWARREPSSGRCKGWSIS